MMQSEQINELAGALAKAQGTMANATMNKTNPHFKSKYADLASVLDAIRGPLSANGLSVVQIKEITERGLVLKTMLMHSSGQFITSEYPLPATQRPHEMGSALTYARRYSIAALICNSADEDDDGNAAMTAKPNGNHATVQAAPRQNPHVTRPEDIYDHTDEDVLPRPDIDTKPLSKAKANPVFKELQDSLWKCGSASEMTKWSIDNKERIGQLPEDWHRILRGVYVEHRDAIAQQTAADETRMAG